MVEMVVMDVEVVAGEEIVVAGVKDGEYLMIVEVVDKY